MLIYKILTAPQWAQFQADGHFDGAPIDLIDGYIHFSDANQAAETAAKHFTAQTGLKLAACDADGFGADLKWEKSRGDALFPHLYRPSLTMADVVWCRDLPFENGAHVFGDLT
ncbi:DUF952 domain-containing protein [Aestuariibius sp. HNIBRBA575]|uniref:DUF952 domain-containing protein n=1 Tax=Aestuariibius sp. HNIBRBA575 TaxID=3233343 RepID=UPI0034A1617B